MPNKKKHSLYVFGVRLQPLFVYFSSPLVHDGEFVRATTNRKTRKKKARDINKCMTKLLTTSMNHLNHVYLNFVYNIFLIRKF